MTASSLNPSARATEMAQACQDLARRCRMALRAGHIDEAAGWADATEDMAINTARHVRGHLGFASVVALFRASSAFNSTRPAVDAWQARNSKERRS
ncbi:MULTISPECIES: hypothetical protein [unclassified Frondihabitans]|uniref:hypothetical protein n=1 Tax=unclassified Frondihabitans TaxID=2626248 RepID=UPI000F4E8A80|nr:MULTISPECIES: hypothetical protein [unclassified Frondihabitans]RPE78954.1 hypothetical protein EDF37_1642 [Frondihabitans sp. PhB153]RPF09235.1 hypothetical protein EDF39_1644 [Frondihabitans sp. PhB161]